MVTPTQAAPSESRRDTDTDPASSGWDPYIVEITGSAARSVSAATREALGGAATDVSTAATDSRKARLVAWLKEWRAREDSNL